jgi:hypothetical protein
MPAANMGTVPEFDLPQIDRLLTTTRAVRKRLDLERPVEPEVIQECIRIAYIPTGDAEWISYDWETLLYADGDSVMNASLTKTAFDSPASWEFRWN